MNLTNGEVTHPVWSSGSHPRGPGSIPGTGIGFVDPRTINEI